MTRQKQIEIIADYLRQGYHYQDLLGYKKYAEILLDKINGNDK